MGTRWSALFHAPAGFDAEALRTALAATVDAVDRQMSTWKPDSDLMRINRAPVGQWVRVRPELMTVLGTALTVGRLSGGAFDIGIGDAVTAWGFGPQQADPQAIRRALDIPRSAAHEVLQLDLDGLQARKLAPVALDLSGIAKGFAVDQMMSVLRSAGIDDALVGLDGELRASGSRPGAQPWTIAVERPDYDLRAPLSVIELNDSAVATSGDYRHWVDVGPKRLSHTMDPARGGPLTGAPASVTVLAATCMQADAWATALMVAGAQKGADLARDHGLTALFIHRDGDELRQTRVGWHGRA